MSTLVNVFGWSSLIVALFVVTFGVQVFLLLLAIVLLVICSAFVALKSIESENKGRNKYDNFFDSETKVELRSLEEVFLFFTALANTSPYRVRQVVQENEKQLITGEPDIDEQLNDVINLLFRDYVHSWYKHVSPNPDFIDELRTVIVDVIKNVAQRARSMDKVNYLTTKLVDDFASHLKLYRLAENRLKMLKIEDPNANLLSIFFDFELQMEQNHLCRDVISEHEDASTQYLTHLCDILQYLLLPPECFNNRPIRVFIRTLMVNSVFCPLLDLLSDPDFINRTLVWLFKSKLNHTPTSETFLLVIRCCDNSDELNAVLEMVNHEIAVHQSQDTGGEDDFDIKQQLNSLLYLQKVIRSRLKCLTSGDTYDVEANELSSMIDMKKFAVSGTKLFQIPFDVVLKNNVALSYFIEYMSSIGAQGHVYFFLNVEGFRVSAEQQLSEEALSENSKSNNKNCDFNLNSLKEAASNIYDTYLSLEKMNSHKLINDENIIRIVSERIKIGKLSETWFDEAHQKVFEIMRDEEKFFPSFKKSIHYIKLLAELDLLKEIANNNNGCNSQKSNDDGDSGSIKSVSSFDSDSIPSFDQADDYFTIDSSDSDNFTNSNQEIIAEITNTGIVREFGNPYGVYCITVIRKDVTNPNESKWCVLRRYSDFYTFHQSTLAKFPPMRNLAIPGKRAFNNMSKEFLEQRRHLLNSYLQQVLRRLGPQSPAGLKQHILQFLEPGNYEKEKTSVKLSKTMNTIVNPFKTSVKTMGNVIKASSDNIKDGFNKLSKFGSIGSTPSLSSLNVKSKSLQSSLSSTSQSTFLPPLINNSKVGKALDIETEDNIPLRIMLLLMDEVFDLKNKNMWLRRRIVAVVRQIIAATFGDKINRKIVDYVQEIVSSAAITEYIRAFKNYFWPNGGKMQHNQERSVSTKMRTKIAAKMLLLSHLSDDFKHVIGSETTRKGLLCVFQMLQIEQLNKRLVFVLLEGFLQALFPENYFPEVFERLHSSGARLKGKNQKKTKWPPYLSKFNGSAIVSSSFSSPSSSGKSSPLSNRHKY